jgi:zinc transport system substrate-binding protein
MLMKKKIFYITFIIFSMLLTGCTNEKSKKEENQDKLSITVSSYPLEFIVQEIGGDLVDVHSILTPGTDAHTYEPTAKTIVEIARSDLFIYTGAIMEPYAESIANSLKSEQVLLISLDGVEEVFNQQVEDIDEGHTEEKHEHHASDEDTHDHEEQDVHQHGDLDPHFWLDPSRMIAASEHIKTELSHHFPEYAETFNLNFRTLENELEKLDSDFSKMMENQKNDTIFVSHAAYGYWERKYGIKQLSIRGISPSNEPSQKELRILLDQIEEMHIPYVILEQNQSDRIAQLITEEFDLDILYIHNLASLTEDEIKSGEDYVSIMTQNIMTIEKALRR